MNSLSRRFTIGQSSGKAGEGDEKKRAFSEQARQTRMEKVTEQLCQRELFKLGKEIRERMRQRNAKCEKNFT